MTVNAGSLSVKLDLDSKTFTTNMSAATAVVTGFQRVAGKTSQLLSSLGSSFSAVDVGKFASHLVTTGEEMTSLQRVAGKTSQLLLKLGSSFSATDVGKVTSQLITTGEEMTNLQRKLEVITNSINRANDGFAGGSRNVQSYAETYAYLRNTALATGSDFDDLAKFYVQLLPAATDAGIAVQDVRKSIEGTIGVGQSMGASSEQVARAFATMRQIIGKNALQQDLRGQLDEALPNSTLILADGLTKIAGQSEDVRREFGLLSNDAQVTTAQLGKLITEGKVDGALFVRAWKEGTAEMAKFAQIANTTPSGQMNNLATIVQTNAGSFVRDSGINQWLAETAASFNSWLDGLTSVSAEKAREIGLAITGEIRDAISVLARKWDEAFDLNSTVFTVAVSGLRQVATGTAALMDVLPGWAIEMGIIGYLMLGKMGVKGLGIVAATIMGTFTSVKRLVAASANGNGELKGYAGTIRGILTDTTGTRDPAVHARGLAEYRGIDEKTAAAILDPTKSPGERDSLIQRYRVELLAEEQAIQGMRERAQQLDETKLNSGLVTAAKKERRANRLIEEADQRSKALEPKLKFIEDATAANISILTNGGTSPESVPQAVTGIIDDGIKGLQTIISGASSSGPTATERVNSMFDSIDQNTLNNQLTLDLLNSAQIDIVKRLMDNPAFAKLSPAKQEKALNAITEAISKFQASFGPRSQTVKIISDLNKDLREVTGAENNDELLKLLSGPIDDTVIGKFFSTTPKGQELWGNGADAKKILQNQIIEAMKSIANTPAQYETTRERDADIGYREGELRRYGNIYKNLGGNEEDFVELQAKLAGNKRRLIEADNQRNNFGLAAASGKEQEALADRLKMSTADVDRAKRAREAFIEISGIDISGNPEIPAVNKARSALKTKEDLAVSRGELKNEDRVADRDMNELARLSVDAFLTDNAKQRGQVIAQITAMTDQQYLTAINLLDTDNRRLSILQAENQARQNGTVPAVRDQLMLEKEKLAAETNRLNVLLREDGPRGQMFANEITTINNQTMGQQLRAQMMGTASWQTAQYGSDKANVDVQLAQTYYEYSLSAEQRLQLARNEGLTTFTGAFSTAISGILSGQQSLGEGFRSMFGTITTYMLDFFAKWIAQSLVMKALGFFGMFGGTSAETGGGWLSNAEVDSVAPGHLYHSGGMIGSSNTKRMVPASIFAGAERFHTGGLLRDEVPIIAKRGEGVFTPEQMNNADSLLKSALTSQGRDGFTQNVSINVAGGAGTPQQNEDLAVRIQRALREEMRGVAANEIRRQMRPNGMLNGGY